MKPRITEYSSEEEVNRLAESGDPIALEIQALAMELGFKKVSSPNNHIKLAAELWKKASDLGSAKASFHLAHLLNSGAAGMVDKKLTAALFKKAEKGGFLTDREAWLRIDANRKSSAKLGRNHVLLIDSHEQDIERLGSLLKAHGCYLSHVKNGSAGLDFLAKNADVKLIFTELNQQLMGGIEFLKRMRSSDYKNLPVVVYSSDVSKDHIVEAKKLKIMGWLMKPVSKEKLNEIMKVVSKSQNLAS